MSMQYRLLYVIETKPFSNAHWNAANKLRELETNYHMGFSSLCKVWKVYNYIEWSVWKFQCYQMKIVDELRSSF